MMNFQNIHAIGPIGQHLTSESAPRCTYEKTIEATCSKEKPVIPTFSIPIPDALIIQTLTQTPLSLTLSLTLALTLTHTLTLIQTLTLIETLTQTLTLALTLT